MNIYIVTIIIILSIAEGMCHSEKWGQVRKPLIFGNQIPYRALNTNNPRVMKKIVNTHNFFRTKVSPPASNMLKLKWHRGAAERARHWAGQCQFLQHDPAENRYVKNYGNCGQNIFVSTHQLSWNFVIKTWFLEYQNFTYGSMDNNLKAIGHYTQMVWATTHEVGCHFMRCSRGAPGGRAYYSYICDYCPSGNWDGKIGTPYKVGKPCSRCPRYCKYNKLCTNSCPYTDQWSNCRELSSYGKGWLCGTNDVEGRNRYNYCKATCSCRNKIHEWR